MITLATFSRLSDAFLLRSMLEANEIAAFIPDENTCQVDWNYINALGGVRVQVADEQVAAATEILAEFRSNMSRDTSSERSPLG